AGGMQIATQHVWNPGYGYDVELATTSPATGSEYMVGGNQLGRKELDPLGADVTQPPTPMLIPEPIFYNPKFDQMLLQIEGGPSDEYEQNNADWAVMVTATIQAAIDRDRAEKLWQSGKRSEAMAILHRNPNVGVEYNVLAGDKVVKSGSYFGQAAADFLNGLSMALGAGLLSPVTEQSGTLYQPGEKPMDTGEMEKIVTKECLSFLNSILANLEAPHSTDFNTIFKMAKTRKLYTKRLTREELTERFAGTHSVVGDPRSYIYIDEEIYNRGDYTGGYILIHELFHAAGSTIKYNHTQMATAAYAAGRAKTVMKRLMEKHGIKEPKVVSYTGDYKQEDWDNSGIFDSIVRLGCPKPK
ncbi:MAG TPA: hypothetical protein VFS76_11885, partial [Pyrinomonadaceae bacterium]|nr:hypothetical protein [Pyrinomonadaceae bacterium]